MFEIPGFQPCELSRDCISKLHEILELYDDERDDCELSKSQLFEGLVEIFQAEFARQKRKWEVKHTLGHTASSEGMESNSRG